MGHTFIHNPIRTCKVELNLYIYTHTHIYKYDIVLKKVITKPSTNLGDRVGFDNGLRLYRAL